MIIFHRIFFSDCYLQKRNYLVSIKLIILFIYRNYIQNTEIFISRLQKYLYTESYSSRW